MPQVVDPVCKMVIESEKAVAVSEYKGRKYYFCAKGCKILFDKDPEKYLEASTEEQSQQQS